jgi:FAD synthase
VTYRVLEGVVVRGDRRGRELGFPTANVEVDGGELVLLADGVYEGWLEDTAGVRRLAAISVGGRPTYYGENGERLIEAHVLDFDGNLYGQLVRVGVGRAVRGQVRFSSSEELIDQMRKDVEVVKTASEGSR